MKIKKGTWFIATLFVIGASNQRIILYAMAPHRIQMGGSCCLWNYTSRFSSGRSISI